METILLILVFLMFASGAPLFAVIVGFSLVGGMTTARDSIWESFGTNLVDVISMGTSDKAKILSTIPLFIFIGYVLAAGKTADRMVRAATSALGWLPGGLAIVTIFACAAFTTFTGASGVTIVALGSLVLPSLVKEKYPERFSLGLVAGTGSVGLLFPPAVPLFVFSTMYGLAFQGVVKEYPDATPLDAGRWLFAGIVPGLVLCTILCIYAVSVAIRHKVPRHAFDAKELGRAMFTALPELLLPVLIIGGLANGIDVPEIASLAVVYVVAIEVFLYKDVKLKDLGAISKNSMALVGAIFIIIFTAQGLANYFVTAGIPKAMVDFFTNHIDADQWWLFLLAVNLILIVAGMVMDIFSAIVIIVPLLALPAARYGIDPYHLGVIFLLNLEIGYITPPVGLNLFITAFKFKKPVVEVTRATLPFLTCMVLALVIVTYVPALTVVPPKTPTGDLAALGQILAERRSTLGAIEEVTLPDGKVKKMSECAAMTDPAGKGRCEGLFVDVTKCRKQADAAKAANCEKDRIQAFFEYKDISKVTTEDLLKVTGDDDDDDDDDDEDADDDDDDDDDDDADDADDAGDTNDGSLTPGGQTPAP